MHASWTDQVKSGEKATDLADAVLEALEGLIVDAQEGLGRALLGGLVLQAPHAVLVGKALRHHADLGQDPNLSMHFTIHQRRFFTSENTT